LLLPDSLRWAMRIVTSEARSLRLARSLILDAQAWLPSVVGRVEPVAQADLRSMLGQLMTLDYIPPRVIRDAEELGKAGGNAQALMTAWWEDYDRALGWAPAWAVRAAVRSWKESPERTFPTPGQLLHLLKGNFRLRAARADADAIKKIALAEPIPDPPTPEEIEAASKRIEELMARYRADKAKREAAALDALRAAGEVDPQSSYQSAMALVAESEPPPVDAQPSAVLLSVRDVAYHYQVGPSTIWRWTRSVRDFPQPVKISNGCTRWRRADLEAFDASRQRSVTSSPVPAPSTPAAAP
jgi:predicted DNA-binding transcriptional regulator AlpA